MSWKVPLFDLDFGTDERDAVTAVLDAGWLSMGPRTRDFEAAFAEYTGARHAVAVANGTAALHLAMIAAGVGPGDEVIVPDITFVASASAVTYVGATAVLADVVGPLDLTLDPADVARKITRKTRAIVPVHLAGYPCRMDELRGLADERGVAIVEDCAHAPGARYAGTHVGRFGVAGAFSFFSNKNISTGEGGMLITDDEAVAARARSMRSHGLTSGTADRHAGHAWGYDVTELGYNYRLSEIEAALGLVQLGKLDANNAHRAARVSDYLELLSGVPGLELAFSEWAEERPPGSASAYHVQIVELPDGTDRRAVADAMAADGIQTSLHYRPIHTFSSPHVAAMRAQGLERADALGGRLLTLPLYPQMTRGDVKLVAESLRSALGV